MTIHSTHDAEQWDAFRLGDKSAYAQIYERYFDALYSYGKRFVLDHTQVEDAIQDLFINLWRTREKLSAVDNIKFYLFRSLRRDIRRLSEKEKFSETIDLENLLLINEYPAEEQASPESQDELTQRLIAILKNLPKRQLEAIMLRYYENFGIDEIASIMNVSEKTVRNTLHNSITLLRKNSNLFYPLLKLAAIYFWW